MFIKFYKRKMEKCLSHFRFNLIRILSLKGSQNIKNASQISKGPFLRVRDNNFRSGIFFSHFEKQSILRLLGEGVRELGPGKFFMGQNVKLPFFSPF